jgi:hypothetical protein
MKNTVKLLILMGMGLFLTSCYYDTFPEENVPDEVSYSKNIQPLWNSSCVTCHSGNLAPDLRAQNSYNSLMNGGFVKAGNADESTLFLSLYEGTGVSLMPPKPNGPWPDSNRKLVETWINQGAKNN